MKNALFWDVRMCGCSKNRNFVGAYHLHHRRSKNRLLVTLMADAIRSSETSVPTRATWRNIPKDGILHNHRCENLKSSMESTHFINCVVPRSQHSECLNCVFAGTGIRLRTRKSSIRINRGKMSSNSPAISSRTVDTLSIEHNKISTLRRSRFLRACRLETERCQHLRHSSDSER
jgi:hypothetical protein